MYRLTTGPVGAEVNEFRLPLDGTRTVGRLKALMAHRGMVVLRGLTVDDATFVTFLEALGSLMFTQGETPVPGQPALNLVSNVGRTTRPRSVFHVDTSYVSRPPAYTALRAVEIPARGGATVFTNQYRAFSTLPSTLRRGLEGRTIRHVLSGLEPSADQETEAEHPVFRRHPISGRTALYLSTPERCTAISGLTTSQSRAMVDLLYRHSIRDDNTYRHRWSPGDVVIWDNRCVMHRAEHADVVGDRVLHRGIVADS